MPKEIKLIGKYSNGRSTIVDDDIYEQLKDTNIFCSREGYAGFSLKDKDGKWKHIYLHRYITNCPKDKLVDHINHDTLDNRRENLRICLPKENVRNSRKPNNKNANSKYKGVTKRKNSYEVNIKTDEGNIRIGSFSTEESAANIYNHYAKIYHGEFACLNQVPFMSYEECLKYQVKRGDSSKYKGVHWDNEKNGWVCQVYLTKDKRSKKIGVFTNEIAAANAYNYYLKEFNEDESKLNDVEYMDKNEWEKYIKKRFKKSKYTGVSYKDGKWEAKIVVNKQTIRLGVYKTEELAAKAYNEYIVKNKIIRKLNDIN